MREQNGADSYTKPDQTLSKCSFRPIMYTKDTIGEWVEFTIDGRKISVREGTTWKNWLLSLKEEVNYVDQEHWYTGRVPYIGESGYIESR